MCLTSSLNSTIPPACRRHYSTWTALRQGVRKVAVVGQFEKLSHYQSQRLAIRSPAAAGGSLVRRSSLRPRYVAPVTCLSYIRLVSICGGIARDAGKPDQK